jgi:SAM-dependent methyltransferase
MFEPPPELLRRFDVVFSLGVVEHFEDTTTALKALSAFLKPGGVLLTIIPNMTGLIGDLQRTLNAPVYRIHVPLTAGDLREYHERAGLSVLRSEFLMSTNFGVINLNGLQRGPGLFFRRATLAVLTRLSRLAWFLESVGLPAPTTRRFAPYIVCVGIA